jgi:amidase
MWSELMHELLNYPATALARQITQHQVSSEEIIRFYLERIDKVNSTINAIVQLRADAALAEAREADTMLASGQVRGPLHGVPFTVKDVFDVAGVISAAGLPERANFVPEQDAVVVARMRAAGGILLGKTNCPPGGGGGESDNPVYGRTNNPYNFEHTAGGSSGGEAALLAAGGSALGLGSDSGGSIRTPAHFCGVAGLKPTFGRVPNTGVLNHPGGLSDPRTQIGPMSRFVEDLDVVLRVISGEDWRDSSVIPMPLRDTSTHIVHGLRIAYYTEDDICPTYPEIAAVVRTTAQALADVGLHVEENRPSAIPMSFDITKRYWTLGDCTGDEVLQLYEDWTNYRTEMLTFMEHYDLILCPVSAVTAPPHGGMTAERFSFTLPFSLTGWPCATVRAGTSTDNLPIGVQVVARPWREDVAVTVARLIEQTLGGWKRSTLLP